MPPRRGNLPGRSAAQREANQATALGAEWAGGRARYLHCCTGCGELVETASRTPGACPECGATMRRRYTAPGVTYRTSGFYTTDHRS